MDDPDNLPIRGFCHVDGVISPVHGVRLSSGKKQCVFKEEDYKMHESPNWANLTFKTIEINSRTIRWGAGAGGPLSAERF